MLLASVYHKVAISWWLGLEYQDSFIQRSDALVGLTGRPGSFWCSHMASLVFFIGNWIPRTSIPSGKAETTISWGHLQKGHSVTFTTISWMRPDWKGGKIDSTCWWRSGKVNLQKNMWVGRYGGNHPGNTIYCTSSGYLSLQCLLNCSRKNWFVFNLSTMPWNWHSCLFVHFIVEMENMRVLILLHPRKADCPRAMLLLSKVRSCEENLEGDKMWILGPLPPIITFSQMHFYYY